MANRKRIEIQEKELSKKADNILSIVLKLFNIVKIVSDLFNPGN